MSGQEHTPTNQFQITCLNGGTSRGEYPAEFLKACHMCQRNLSTGYNEIPNTDDGQVDYAALVVTTETCRGKAVHYNFTGATVNEGSQPLRIADRVIEVGKARVPTKTKRRISLRIKVPVAVEALV